MVVVCVGGSIPVYQYPLAVPQYPRQGKIHVKYIFSPTLALLEAPRLAFFLNRFDKSIAEEEPESRGAALYQRKCLLGAGCCCSREFVLFRIGTQKLKYGQGR